MDRDDLKYSKSRVNRAGERLAAFWADRSADVYAPETIGADLAEDISVFSDFRRAHGRALQTTTSGLRYYVRLHASGPVIVAQRLKRLPTILDKLNREPGMKLVRMEDIGGCRAVVPTPQNVRDIADHLRRRRKKEIVRLRDYMAKPKPETGYRAIHLVLEKFGRRIEIQIRTQSQHNWAEHVEAVDRRNHGLQLKAGRAPAEVQRYFWLGAELLDRRDAGQALDPATLREFGALHAHLGTALQEGTYVRTDA